MTPEEQRIAIAEACPDIFIVYEGRIFWRCKVRGISHEEVDPLNDLNAIQAAVQSMSGQERKAFVNVLWCVVNPDLATKWDEASPLAFADYINATAAQRAEAFLRTKGLWKD